MHDFQKFPMLLLIVGTLIFSGCGDGGGSSVQDPSVNPSGIWLGYQEVHEQAGSGIFDMKTIIYDGRFYGISEDANIMYAGTYQTGGGKYLVAIGSEGSDTSYKMYGIHDDGHPFARGITTLTIGEKELLQGGFENEVLQEGNITSHYSTLTGKGASLSYLEGTISRGSLSLSVKNTGTLSGSKGSCTLDGAVSVPQSSMNIYEVLYNLSGAECEKAGTYEGYGIVALDANDQAYFLALAVNADASRMDMMSYPLAQTPAPFLSAGTVAMSATDNAAADTAIGSSETEEPAGEDTGSKGPAPANFSGAWWQDGTRCGAVSINGCSERTYPTGLTYEEVRRRRSDLQTSRESRAEHTRENAQSGTRFVIETDTFW